MHCCYEISPHYSLSHSTSIEDRVPVVIVNHLTDDCRGIIEFVISTTIHSRRQRDKGR
jgi:hypothetical protein